jgi:hypothetical protein
MFTLKEYVTSSLDVEDTPSKATLKFSIELPKTFICKKDNRHILSQRNISITYNSIMELEGLLSTTFHVS